MQSYSNDEPLAPAGEAGGGRAAAAAAWLRSAIERRPVLVPFVIYVLFALAIYAIHGPQPPLSIDHIAYFKLADEIREQFHSASQYWQSVNSVRFYGIILAQMYDFTGSHVTSLKVVLAILTVAYLGAFQVFMGVVTPSRPRAVLFSLVSALFVSFGASIWGVTDFAASLNRTLIIPFVVLLVAFFIRFFHSPWRYAVFPALIALSFLHLSALHVFLVFGAFEVVDFVFRRRFRIDRNVPAFIAAIVASVLVQGTIEVFAGGTTSYVRYTLNMAVPKAAEYLPPEPPAPKPPKPKSANVYGEAPTVAAPEQAQPFGAPLPDKLSNQRAWEIELQAFPWRNFPPSPATLATMLASFGVILALSITGAVRALRTDPRPLDRVMVLLTAGVVLAAYGLQVLLWFARKWTPVFPVNFEEVRAVNMLMIPAAYFTFRLYELAPALGRMSRRAVRIAIVIAFMLQPILLVRSLPASWREAVIDRAVAAGVLNTSDAPRMLYARQFLGLAGDGRRFYYSTRGVINWLEQNAGPDEVVLTNLNEFYGSRVRSVGPFLAIVQMDVWDVRRARWAEALEAVNRALAARDLDKIKAMARSMGATYAVVEWPVEDAVYSDANYSIVRVRR